MKKKQTIRLLFPCFVITILLISCINQTNISTASITLTNTPEILRTPSVTKTVNSATFTPSPPPSATIPAATLNARATLEQLIPICDSGYQWEFSPDRNWIVALTCSGGSQKTPFYMKVLNIVDGREWRVNFDTDKFGYYDGNLYPAHWSEDGRFLYVGVIKQMDGPGIIFINATILLRLNLFTGEITEILSDGFHVFAFSNKDKLAYLTDKGINIIDVVTWKSSLYPIDTNYCKIGDLLWSPNEDEIIYQAWTCNDNYDYSSYDLFLLDLNSRTSRKLISSDELLPRSIKWENKFPSFSQWDAINSNEVCLELNLESNEWVTIDCPE
jgi:hypothetical protein